MDLDYDMAYFMRYGKYPPPRERDITVLQENWETYELGEELYDEFKMSNFREYFDPAQTYRYALYK